MQTFLTHSNFKMSACALDRLRLGKQRVEAYQILRTLCGRSQGWKNHPAVKMWAGYEGALCLYAQTMCAEWVNRGYTDNMATRLHTEFPEFTKPGKVTLPPWFGNESFHAAHRAALLYKDFDYYRKWSWPEEPELNYFWPV